MINLVLCILSATGIFLSFKIIDQKNIPSYPVILINYLIAAVLGYILNGGFPGILTLTNTSWIRVSILIGFLFIVFFFLISKSTKEVGISITTLAGKMSVVFPISYSIFIDSTDKPTFLKLTAITLALAGVIFSIYKPHTDKTLRNKLIIPALLFVGMGMVDSFVKYAQHNYVGQNEAALFSATLFAMSFLTGLFFLPIQKSSLAFFKKGRTWLWGIILGFVNFGSIYFLVSALNWGNSPEVKASSSVIFGANNISIVTLSLLIGLFFFKEKLNILNWIGISLSIIALILFSIA